METLSAIFNGALSLLVGMKVTFAHFFRPSVTSQYPHEQPQLSEAYRHAITLVEKDGLGSHDCMVCLACQRVCPSMCIEVEGDRPEGLRRKRPTEFTVNFAQCSECGLCIEACSTQTLGFSKRFDEAGYRPDDFIYDLLAPWKDKEEGALTRLRAAEAEKTAAAEARKKAAPSSPETPSPKDAVEQPKDEGKRV